MYQIRKGGKLIEIYWHYDEEAKEGSYKERDVTEQAIRCLFDRCSLASDVTLRDVFELLNTEIELFDAVLGNWCKDLVKEGLTGTPDADQKAECVRDIEFLELYWTIIREEDNDTSKSVLQGLIMPGFHGVGYELMEDKEEYGYTMKKGYRTPWGVSFLNTTSLIDLPLRLKNEVEISDDMNWKPGVPLKQLATFDLSEYSLGHILHGIIWELSFYGGPESRDEKKQEVFNLADEIKREE
jgi:hypothetical protein